MIRGGKAARKLKSLKLAFPIVYGTRAMITVVCKKCGYVFYKGNKIPNLYKIYASVGGQCPKCGTRIDWVPQDVEVRKRRVKG